MNEKQRTEFEKWFTRQVDSEYCSPNVKALMSECWQAAISSVVVKLPETPADAKAHVYSVKVRIFLDEAGIRYE